MARFCWNHQTPAPPVYLTPTQAAHQLPPVTHTFIDHIHAPIERVFTLLTDPVRMPEWLPGCRS
jgi:hypothetical protein